MQTHTQSHKKACKIFGENGPAVFKAQAVHCVHSSILSNGQIIISNAAAHIVLPRGKQVNLSNILHTQNYQHSTVMRKYFIQQKIRH